MVYNTLFDWTDSQKDDVFFKELRRLFEDITDYRGNYAIIVDDIDSLFLNRPAFLGIVILKSLFKQLNDEHSRRCLIITSGATYGAFEQAMQSYSDVVLSLENKIVDDAPLRLLHVLKNNFANVFPLAHVFTLEGGTFVACLPFPVESKRRITSWNVVPDKKGRCSTGSTHLDDFFGTGYLLGSMNLFEIDLAAIPDARLALLGSILNFLKQERGVIISTLSGVNSMLVDKESMGMCVDASIINENLRIISMQGNPSLDGRPYVVNPPRGTAPSLDCIPAVYDDLCKKTGYKPILIVTEIDAGNLHDPVYRKEVLQHVHFVKNANVVNLVIMHQLSNDDHVRIISQLADSHFKLYDVHGVLVFSGIHPSIVNLAIECGPLPTLTLLPRRIV